MKDIINVTSPYIPQLEDYTKYLSKAFDNKYLTNNGPLVQELTNRLKEKLGVKHLLLVSNGTLALQIAYKLKELSNKSVLTTPYTFAATATSIKWEGSEIAFADIDQTTWNISAKSIKQKLEQDSANNIKAIVPVNLFGLPCELEEIDILAKEHNSAVIYDSAHALFSKYKGKSIFEYGDIHCVSLHATKLFHTGEGGLMTFKNEQDYVKAKQLINFGITETQDIETAGINGKMSELHAAMGLAVLDNIDQIIEERESLVALYKQELCDVVEFQTATYNHYSQPIYMPIKFSSVETLLDTEKRLVDENIFPRRYFMPNHLKFIENIAEIEEVNACSDIANKTLCLPLMNGLPQSEVIRISQLIKRSCK